MRHLPTYLRIAGMTIQSYLTYRLNVALYLVSLLFQVYLLRVVWTSVYAGRPSAEGMPLAELLAYLTVGTLQMALLRPRIPYVVEWKLREGSIGSDLAQPTPFVGQLIARQVGHTAGELPYVLLGLPFAGFIGVVQAPPSLAAAALYALSLALAYAIVLLIGLVIGLLAFATIQVHGFLMIYRWISYFLGGALIPLAFFPEWLRAVASALPFQTQAHIPLGLYLGRIAPAEALSALGTQLLWIVLLYGLAHIGWRWAAQRVVVQGG